MVCNVYYIPDKVSPVIYIWAKVHHVVVVCLVIRDGVATSVTVPETRVWQKFDKEWKCIHSHRSAGATNSSASAGSSSSSTSKPEE